MHLTLFGGCGVKASKAAAIYDDGRTEMAANGNLIRGIFSSLSGRTGIDACTVWIPSTIGKIISKSYITLMLVNAMFGNTL